MEKKYGWHEDFCIVCGCEDCDEQKCKDRLEDMNPLIIKKTMEELIAEIWQD